MPLGTPLPFYFLPGSGRCLWKVVLWELFPLPLARLGSPADAQHFDHDPNLGRTDRARQWTLLAFVLARTRAHLQG